MSKTKTIDPGPFYSLAALPDKYPVTLGVVWRLIIAPYAGICVARADMYSVPLIGRHDEVTLSLCTISKINGTRFVLAPSVVIEIRYSSAPRLACVAVGYLGLYIFWLHRL